jgi:hypothetical protein
MAEIETDVTDTSEGEGKKTDAVTSPAPANPPTPKGGAPTEPPVTPPATLTMTQEQLDDIIRTRLNKQRQALESEANKQKKAAEDQAAAESRQAEEAAMRQRGEFERLYNDANTEVARLRTTEGQYQSLLTAVRSLLEQELSTLPEDIRDLLEIEEDTPIERQIARLQKGKAQASKRQATKPPDSGDPPPNPAPPAPGNPPNPKGRPAKGQTDEEVRDRLRESGQYPAM